MIDFVARLFGLSSYEAAKKLAYDFGIDPDKPPAAMALKKPYPLARELAKRGLAVPVCPEQLGGLPTPRKPSERRGERVVMNDGRDVTAEYRRGAEEALRLARLYGCTAAVLKEKSPSCGCGRVYDGTFSGTLTDGDGVTAALLKENGIKVYGESELEKLL